MHARAVNRRAAPPPDRRGSKSRVCRTPVPSTPVLRLPRRSAAGRPAWKLIDETRQLLAQPGQHLLAVHAGLTGQHVERLSAPSAVSGSSCEIALLGPVPTHERATSPWPLRWSWSMRPPSPFVERRSGTAAAGRPTGASPPPGTPPRRPPPPACRRADRQPPPPTSPAGPAARIAAADIAARLLRRRRAAHAHVLGGVDREQPQQRLGDRRHALAGRPGIGARRARGSTPPLWMLLRMSSKPMSASDLPRPGKDRAQARRLQGAASAALNPKFATSSREVVWRTSGSKGALETYTLLVSL